MRGLALWDSLKLLCERPGRRVKATHLALLKIS